MLDDISEIPLRDATAIMIIAKDARPTPNIILVFFEFNFVILAGSANVCIV
ncbi:MAG: hypothetical protein ACE1Z0_03390 [Acidimicrobiia bacterium]